MWQDLLLAFGLVLIIEGILPALNPRGWKQMMSQLVQMDDRILRWVGIGCMIFGAILFNLAN